MTKQSKSSAFVTKPIEGEGSRSAVGKQPHDVVSHWVSATSLVQKYGQYTTDYDTDTSVKRIKTLRNNVVNNTAVWIINYG